MDKEQISLVQECTNKYFIEHINENELEIHIRIPMKFRNLWLTKISELNTTQEEIIYYQDD
jgi:hypothetical protein